MGGPALFLRHVSASGWDNAFVNFDHRTWFPAPNYVVMKLWREHYAPRRIAVEGSTGSLSVVATRSKDGKVVYFKAVNPTEEDVKITVTLSSGAVGQVLMQIVAPGDLSARNSLDSPYAVRPKPARVNRDGRTLRFDLPPLSCGVLEVRGE
jgi:alpha-N-arabinofuranosidase